MGGHLCPWWLAYTFDNPVRALFHKPAKIFCGLVSSGMTVADIGCGMGFFSLGLAELVGDNGTVLAVDVQQKMLDTVARRARKRGLSRLVRTHLSMPGRIGIAGPVDFALASWMVHETSDVSAFLRQVHALLRPGGFLLVTEPKLHVSREEIEREIELAQQAGFSVTDRPRIAFSHAVLFRKAGQRA